MNGLQIIVITQTVRVERFNTQTVRVESFIMILMSKLIVLGSDYFLMTDIHITPQKSYQAMNPKNENGQTAGH